MDRRQINRVPMFTRGEDSGERPVDPSIIRSSEGLKEAILAETQPGFVRGCRNNRRIVHIAAAQSLSDEELAHLEQRQAAPEEQRDALAAKKKAHRKARLLRLKEEVRSATPVPAAHTFETEVGGPYHRPFRQRLVSVGGIGKRRRSPSRGAKELDRIPIRPAVPSEPLIKHAVTA